MTYQNRLLGSKYDPYYVNENVDSFGRKRTSHPDGLFEHKQVYDNGVPLYFFHYLTGGGASATYDRQNARTILNCGSESVGRALRQTRRYFNYQAGKSHLIDITFNFSGASNNCEKRAGYYDDQDGIFIALSSANYGVMNLRTASSSSIGSLAITQSAWNVDKFDGEGPSGLRLDWTKTQIFGIDFQWLGVGRVRTGFFINNDFHVAHDFYNANINDAVYMSTPNLPVRWEILAQGGIPVSATMDAICAAVVSEGGLEPIGAIRAAARTTAVAIGAGAIGPVISMRLTADMVRKTAYPILISSAGTTNNSRGIVYLIKNPTLAAPSWILQSSSAVEIDVSATSLTGGLVIASSIIGLNGTESSLTFENETSSYIGADLTGTSDIYTVAIHSIAADSWLSAINWRELV